jgi:hypothetical protein
MSRQSKKIANRINKRKKALDRQRKSWKGGFSKNPAYASITTESSIRTVSGGLPGNGFKS